MQLYNGSDLSDAYFIPTFDSSLRRFNAIIQLSNLILRILNPTCCTLLDTMASFD